MTSGRWSYVAADASIGWSVKISAIFVRRVRNAVEARWSASRFQPIEILPAILAIAAFATITNIGLHVPLTYNVGLAYQGGQAAWQTGHPESVSTWISTPFLAMIMALVSQVMSVDAAVTLNTLLNCALLLAAVAVIWVELRGRVSVWFWWITLVAFVVFAPTASSIFWRQFNIIALAPAAAGYMIAPRRPWVAGLLVAVSLGIKPLVILLPVALLWRKETRRAGVWSIAWGMLLLIASQVFLAARAHDWHDLSPVRQLGAISNNANPFYCDVENFSPLSTWCRLSGTGYLSIKVVLVAIAVLALAVLAARLISMRRGQSWAVFAFVCLLSPMLSPIAWSHYQILLAPMLLVLAYEYVTTGADVVDWTGLACGFALAELTWQPFGTLVGLFRQLLTGKPETGLIEGNVFVVAAFAQFVVLAAAFIWFMRNRTSPAVSRPARDERAGRGAG